MKLFKNRLTVTVIVLSVSFLLLISYSAKRKKVSFVENGVGTVLNSVQGFFYNVNSDVKGFFGFVSNFSEVKSENQELKKKNSQLNQKAAAYDSLKRENTKLKKMFDFKQSKSEYNYVGGDIILKSGSDALKGYVINKGSKDGIKVGMAVINDEGLIGQVTSVANNYCKIETISSENISVAALVQSTQVNDCIVRGYTDNEDKEKNLSILTMLPLNSVIKEGDTIATSGIGGDYPKDIIIGKVKSVEDNKGKMEKEAIIEPAVDFSRLQNVFIVVPKDTSEIKY
ncbi:rod shape-determining protein MreC [Clostridium felsineum]|uniref:rod shape-determining protein MreC n=1 Tax=Clostridium felsineum TaxID=36839 RepID=UPI00098CDBA9|nr:rod shape-determining protein MreC [Clostridium felsineum]URZ15716.1 Cell shape-determining protein MreC [Clostridium felsineum DSM 794]